MHSILRQVLLVRVLWSRAALWGVLLFLAAGCAGADANRARPTTTHPPIAPEFASLYEAYGGESVLGHPITEPFTDPQNGRLLQYLQTLRLEIEPESSPLQIIIFPLGEWALAGLNPAVAVPEPGPVANEFQAFYEAYNGADLLGPPLTAGFTLEERRVQFFRNGRLEWHPELPPAQQVRLSHLGQAHFQAEMAFYYRQDLLARPAPAAGLTEAQMFAAVDSPVVFTGEMQQLVVTVLTPGGRPVPNARVEMRVNEAASGQLLGETNAQGRLAIPVDVSDFTPGDTVTLQLQAYTQSGVLLGETAVSFQLWW